MKLKVMSSGFGKCQPLLWDCLDYYHVICNTTTTGTEFSVNGSSRHVLSTNDVTSGKLFVITNWLEEYYAPTDITKSFQEAGNTIMIEWYFLLQQKEARNTNSSIVKGELTTHCYHLQYN